MTDSTKVPEKNGTPTPNGLENGNGTRSAAGLVVAGLVTVVGSWIGMAAYMDYRLQGMEERIANDTKHQVVSAADITRTTFNTQFGQLNKGIVTKIDDTSSILAKGLLDINQKQGENQEKTLAAITGSGSEISKALNEIKDNSLSQISSLLESQQEAIQNEVSQLVTKVESGNQGISEAVQTISRTTRTSNEAVLASVQNLDNNLAEMNTGLLARMDSNAKSLQDLVKLSNEQGSEKLAELAKNMTSVVSGANEGSSKLTAELSALAQKVSILRNGIAVAQNEIRELNTSVPEWQKSSQQQIAKITESAKAINQDLLSQFGKLQTQVTEMDKRVESTGESLMRALYITSEGMEGTKIEIKSELENSKQETSEEIQNLVQSVRDVYQQLESLQKNVSSQAAGAQSSSLPFFQSPEFEKLTTALKSISLKTNDLRSEIDSQVNEVKARTEILLAEDATPVKIEALRGLLLNFTTLANMAGGKLDTMLDTLDGVSEMMDGMDGKTITRDSDTSQSEESSEIGLNPEDRASDNPNISMQ